MVKPQKVVRARLLEILEKHGLPGCFIDIYLKYISKKLAGDAGINQAKIQAKIILTNQATIMLHGKDCLQEIHASKGIIVDDHSIDDDKEEDNEGTSETNESKGIAHSNSSNSNSTNNKEEVDNEGTSETNASKGNAHSNSSGNNSTDDEEKDDKGTPEICCAGAVCVLRNPRSITPACTVLRSTRG